MVPQERGPTPTGERRPTRLRVPVDQQHRAVVVLRPELLDQPLDPVGLASVQRLLGLADEPVDAQLDLHLRGLHQTVGVEQHGVAGPHHPAHALELGSLDQPEDRTVALQGRPPAAAGGEVDGRRVSGGPDLEVTAGQVEGQLDGGGEPLVPLVPEQVRVGGRQELVQGRPLVYGQSITDGYISWDESVPLLESLAMAVRERRRLRAGAADAERVAAQ